MSKSNTPEFRGTTILAIRKDGRLCVGGDGQVTMNNMIIKSGARKVRRLHDGKVIVGFAGATADAMTLFEKLEGKLQEHGGNLTRAAVELAKDWRTDRYLRRLEALMIAADKHAMFLMSGTGDVLEPDEGVMAIGSGGGYAYAAAKALISTDSLSAEDIVKKSMAIASSICVFTNDQIITETL